MEQNFKKNFVSQNHLTKRFYVYNWSLDMYTSHVYFWLLDVNPNVSYVNTNLYYKRA